MKIRVALWARSLAGKITLIFLCGVLLAYGLGSLVGWTMFVSAANEQWDKRARLNSQIASATLRSVYTYISVGVAGDGQIDSIVAKELIGDDASVLATGLNPIDVLALVSSQTRNAVWLFRFDKDTNAFARMAVAYEDGAGSDEPSVTHESLFGDTKKSGYHLTTGFFRLDEIEHFAGILPIMTPAGEMIGAVAASIGPSSALVKAQDDLLRNSLLTLLIVMCLTGILIAIIAGRLLKPVPLLVQATLRIAREVTDVVTPFQRRTDEIGDLASAIETLREAVVERGRLRGIRDTALQMEHMAHHDVLTGLPNRALLMKELGQRLGACEKGEAIHNVMLLDLDRFKAVNDTLGHAYGDALLIAFADRLTLLLGADDIAARLGGDEFAILQRVTNDAHVEGTKLATSLIDAASKAFFIAGNHLHIGASIGIAIAPAHGTKAASVLHCADTALYSAKAAGRGSARFFRPGMAIQELHRPKVDLNRGLQWDEFEICYQPIVDLAGGETIAMEALVRWHHPTHGLLLPEQFMSLSEHAELLAPFTEWMFMRACQDATAFPHRIAIAISLSSSQLQGSLIEAACMAALDKTGLQPCRLALEVKDAGPLANAAVVAALTTLAQHGVGIVLDNFGSETVPLNSILYLRCDKIKINRELVIGMPGNVANQAIVHSLIGLARNLGIRVGASGVESANEATALRAVGFQSAEGPHFGKACKVNDLIFDRNAKCAVQGAGVVEA
jgi:diguanylate cyclase (GGDEF)-like protein